MPTNKRSRPSAGGSKSASKAKRPKHTIVSDDDMDSSQADAVIHQPTSDVGQLRNSVAELKAQVDFLLNALGWTLPTAMSVKSPASLSASGQSSSATSGGSSTDQFAHPSVNASTSAQYVDVVHHKTSPSNLQRTIRDAVVAAVYVDQKLKDDRAANLVVSGLLPVPQVNDQTIVTDLCRNELGINTDVVHCKRLGKVTEGRVQPLLVVFRTADQADQIMADAKKLRRSSVDVIKDNVFINRHMTAAQSRAAYELRCQRRNNTDKKLNAGGSQQGSQVGPSQQSSDGSMANRASAAKSRKVVGLNANAAKFTMAANADSAATDAADGSN